MTECGLEQYKAHCEELTQRLKEGVCESDCVPIASGVVSAMRAYFGHIGCADRCWSIVGLLDEFCSSNRCLKPVPVELLKGILRELMRNLNHHIWTKGLDSGEALLRKLNLACVMFLQGLPRARATSLLLSLGSDEAAIVSCTLTVKCLKKLAKLYLIPTSCRGTDPEIEKVGEVFDVVRAWLKREQSQLSSAGIGTEGPGSMLDGVQGITVAAKRANPEAARLWISTQLQTFGENDYAVAWFLTTFSAAESEDAAEPISAGRSSAAAGRVTVDRRFRDRSTSLERRRYSAPPGAKGPFAGSPMNGGA